MREYFLPVNKLVEEPYLKILGYPKATKRQLKSRLDELKKLGIRHVSFQGETKLGSLNVLGKGYVGVVILGKIKTKKIAIKIRRVDSQREGMKNEALLLKIANKAKVGPLLIDSSKNFIIMEYLSGEKVGDWVKGVSGKGSTVKLKATIKKILEDCYNLDKIGLDHGELSSISKHVIVGKTKATIIDLESASTKRRVSNVTSATQGIFIGSGIAKRIQKIYKVPMKDEIINSLRIYKKDPNRKSFEKVLDTLKL